MTNKNYQKKDKKKNSLYSDELPPRGDAWKKHEFFLPEPKTLAIVIMVSVLTLLVAFFGERGAKYLTSVLSPIPQHAPFNGTTYPVKQAPNWVKLTESERKANFSALPADKLISVPAYNPTRLVIPNTTLKWNDANDDAIRNEKITYPVPYLGTYKLDGVEGAGSHPAVDIKVPEGTPVYAIANGTVIKAENSSGGFGNHIVLQHNDFPSLDDENVKTTLFSSYNHLSSISVKINDVVTKGQLIGFSGSTGTATTPHLHFQIDNSNSAWHPYWPFTGAEQRAAGYSFFDAINNGLGRGNAVANTVNPMKYVQKYFSDQMIVASANPELTVALANVVDEYERLTFVVQVAGGEKFTEGDEVKFVIQAFDEKGNLVSKPVFTDEVKLSLLNGNGNLNNSVLSAANFKAGISSTVAVSGAKVGKEKLLVRFRDREFSSPEFEMVAKRPVPAGFFVLPAQVSLETGKATDVVIRAVDLNGNKITDFDLLESPALSATNGVGDLSASALTFGNFSNGEASVNFTAKTAGTSEIIVNYHGQEFKSPAITVTETVPTVPTDAQVQDSGSSMIVAPENQQSAAPEIVVPSQIVVPETLAVTSETPTPAAPDTSVQPAVTLPFTDVLANNPHFAALTALKSKRLVAGYPDGTFKPDNPVTRAEAIAFILRGINQSVREKLNLIFPDVSAQAWYAKYVSTAFELGFVKGYPDGKFRPDATVNLAEFFTMLFVGAKVDIDPQITVALPEGITATDWFAPYFQEAIKKNILEVKDNKVEPGKPLTRGDIADILYKVMQVEGVK
ncbi:S-layer homology domain-containing protein [Candidatus Peregrinibacteria bacterium]|nr:S-layer homology domain-containing protein [Candidatus Peregrinibacteria bacterium]